MNATKLKRPSNGTSPQPATIRVGIYARQSVADDLEFNSLEAQRQAVEAFVASQASQGWVALPNQYNDSGFSGGNIDRPAFQRLLKDIEAGRVDVVAVHRLDRLTRSIRDFVRIIDVFEKHRVAFVSTTQSFDTGTSLGRMTVNLLATFATYERDLIRERTREKMAATRKRGLWTGGFAILGYDLCEKKLTVNKDEAERVREIFKLYLSGGSLLSVVEELNRREWLTKAQPSSGRMVGGKPFDKQSVRRILANPLYIGKVLYGGTLHDGAQETIIDTETWEQVQAQLKARSKSPCTSRNASGLLLQGLLRCGPCGAAMSPHYAERKKGKYYYYICVTAQRRGAAACPGSRVAVREIEGFVIERIREIGRDHTLVAETIKEARKALEVRRPEIQGEVRRLEKEEAKLERERKNLVDAVAGGGKTPAVFERLGRVEADFGEVEMERERFEEELRVLERSAIDERDLRRALKSFDPIWNELFPVERTRIIRLLIEKVVYDAQAGEVAITFRPAGVRLLANREDP